MCFPIHSFNSPRRLDDGQSESGQKELAWTSGRAYVQLRQINRECLGNDSIFRGCEILLPVVVVRLTTRTRDVPVVGVLCTVMPPHLQLINFRCPPRINIEWFSGSQLHSTCPFPFGFLCQNYFAVISSSTVVNSLLYSGGPVQCCAMNIHIVCKTTLWSVSIAGVCKSVIKILLRANISNVK